ncbi:MAG TPA: LacI family DNA-binding transcriptional regulator [Bosea sp. (in: a-proteobacteria)]|jgi:LacI family transcriptional regulator|nr:LacI family DNA-binding transcriptional regulator [Bosea sp. (in: a-proteobacteria)]
MTMRRTALKPADAQQASIANVAERAGVSIATVSRVLNGVANKASRETVAKVRQAVAELDYRPSSAGKSLRQKQSRLVAVLAANLANPTMAAIAASTEVALRERGLVMVLCDTHDSPELQDEYLREMRAQQARAIVFLGAVASPMLDLMRGGPTPLVFVNRRDPGDPDGDFVGIDNAQAGCDVAAHALASGIRRPALIHAPLASSATRARVEAITESFAEAGHPIPPSLILGPAEREHLALGYTAAKLLKNKDADFDALICTGDLIAFGAHRFIVEHGSSMPPIYGFDDNPLNDWVAPWLSSVLIPYGTFGQAVAELITGDIEKPDRQRVLPHRLIDRRRS